MIDPEYDCQDLNDYYEGEERRAARKLPKRKPESLQSIQRRLGASAAEAMRIQKSQSEGQ
jgi:hypothetical protein